MVISDDERKIGINFSVPFNYIKRIDQRTKELGFTKRTHYILSLIERDLN